MGEYRIYEAVVRSVCIVLGVLAFLARTFHLIFEGYTGILNINRRRQCSQHTPVGDLVLTKDLETMHVDDFTPAWDGTASEHASQ